jgi:hypothetical protein
MTTILPAERTGFDVIGQTLGQSLQQNLGPALQQRNERSQIQNGLDQLGKLYPQLRPYTESMKPFAGTRQGAQYIESLLPEITKAVQAKQMTGGQGQGQGLGAIDELARQYNMSAGGSVTATQNQPQAPSFEQSYEKIKSDLGEQYFPTPQKAENVPEGETRRPQRPPRPPKPIGLQEERKIRKNLAEDGITDKTIQDQYVQQVKKNILDEYTANLEGYKGVKEYQAAREKEDARFWNDVQPLVKEQFPGMGPEEENIWKGIARTTEDIGGDEVRLRDTNQRYNQLVEQPLAAFVDTGPALPYFSYLNPERVSNAIEDSRSMVQDHLNSIKKIPESDEFPPGLKSEVTNYLRKKYRTSMLSKDFGVAQSAYAVSDLGNKTKKAMDSMPKFPTPKTHPEEPFVEHMKPETKMKYTQSLANTLRTLDPEDSLILARDYAISSGYPDDVFNKALNIAIQNGLQLSYFQRLERPELSIPQRMDMESILRGKRSVWDQVKVKK